ncbi:Hypothetical protein MVR_LOCUS17 [uncultured virus]|nr:Hypothetical protein MVR_LOCUS17 [uncultured virus]
MTVKIGPTRTVITIPKDTTQVVLPEIVKGTVAPGTFDHLDGLVSISWGVNMTGVIEQGTIPNKAITLWLPKTYLHDLAQSQIPSKVTIMIHEDNVKQVPKGLKFLVWSESAEFKEKPELVFEYRQTCEQATAATGTQCYMVWASDKVAEPIPEPTPLPCSLDEEIFELWLAESEQSDPLVPQAQAVASQVGQKIYADLMASVQAHKLHNTFSEMYCIKPFGGRDTYRKVIIDQLSTAYKMLTFTPVEDASDYLSASYKC